MKKGLLLIILVMFSIGNMWAQTDVVLKPKKSAEERAESFTNRMAKNLNLEATQVERFKVLNLERFKQIDEARTLSGENKKQVAMKVREINDAFLNNAKGVLTPEQFTKFQEMKVEMKEKAMARRASRKG